MLLHTFSKFLYMLSFLPDHDEMIVIVVMVVVMVVEEVVVEVVMMVV